MSEQDILTLIKGILNTMEEQSALIRSLVEDNIDLKKRVEKLEGER